MTSRILNSREEAIALEDDLDREAIERERCALEDARRDDAATLVRWREGRGTVHALSLLPSSALAVVDDRVTRLRRIHRAMQRRADRRWGRIVGRLNSGRGVDDDER